MDYSERIIIDQERADFVRREKPKKRSLKARNVQKNEKLLFDQSRFANHIGVTDSFRFEEG